jgi:hypothetical protein
MEGSEERLNPQLACEGINSPQSPSIRGCWGITERTLRFSPMYVKLQITTSTINLQDTSPNLAFFDVLVTSQPVQSSPVQPFVGNNLQECVAACVLFQVSSRACVLFAFCRCCLWCCSCGRLILAMRVMFCFFYRACPV